MIKLTTSGGCKIDRATGFLAKLGAWAYLLESEEESYHSYGTALNTTDNKMEMTAVIEGLKVITEASNIQITINSAYLMNGATIWIYTWKRNNWHTSNGEPVPNKDLWMTLEELISSHVSITWRLDDNTSNDQSILFTDRLCQLALKEVISGLR